MKKEHILLLLGGLILLGRREPTVTYERGTFDVDPKTGETTLVKTESITVPLSESPYRRPGERVFMITDPSGEYWWTSCDDTDEAEASLRKYQEAIGRTVVRMG